MTARQEAAAATRRRILETTGMLVCERGFDKVSIDDIVKACGVARGTFYIYFKNKAEAVREFTRRPFSDLEKHLGSMDAPIAKRIETYILEFTRCLEDYGLPITQQWVREVADPRSSAEDADNDKLRFDLELLTRVLRQAVQVGELRPDTPIHRIAQLITCQLYGQMTCWCMSMGGISMSDTARTYCQQLLPALLAPYLADVEDLSS